MVVDHIHNISLYYGLGEKIKKALNYLAENDFSNMQAGRYDIDGDTIYAVVQNYDTKSKELVQWECHRKYIDVQFISKGQEFIGYTNKSKLVQVHDYDEVRDVCFFDGQGDYITASQNTFLILWPHEAHRPCLTAVNQQMVKKVVVKILV